MNPERSAIHPLFKRIPGAAVTILLVVWAIVQVYPILFMFITSVKTDKQILNAPFALPEPLKFENYAIVWQGDRVAQPFSTFFINSFTITLGSLIILLVRRRAGGIFAGARALPRQRGDAAGLSAHAGGAGACLDYPDVFLHRRSRFAQQPHRHDAGLRDPRACPSPSS